MFMEGLGMGAVAFLGLFSIKHRWMSKCNRPAVKLADDKDQKGKLILLYFFSSEVPLTAHCLYLLFT